MNPVEEVRDWINRVVVALNLCPFAKAPLDAGRVRIAASRGQDAPSILADLLHEIALLDDEDPEADTTLLVITALSLDFDAFVELIDMAEALLSAAGHDGRYQLAHFHPDYVFEDAEPDDPANHTNRAPHPALHILRWDQVAEAVASHPDVAAIPERNQALLRKLGATGIAKLRD
jgi:hypothetical protein